MCGCENCCRQVCVKLTYTIFFSILFFIGLLLCFDTFASIWWVSAGNEASNITVPLIGGMTAVTLRSHLFKMPLFGGFYDNNTQAFSQYNTKNNYNETMYPVQHQFNVTHSNDDGSMVELLVSLVSEEIIDDPNSNATIYWLSLGMGIFGACFYVILMLCVWFCCTNWCTCCCCKPKDKQLEAHLLQV